MDGFELLAERQKDERLRQMPALVPDGGDLREDDHRRLNGGMARDRLRRNAGDSSAPATTAIYNKMRLP